MRVLFVTDAGDTLVAFWEPCGPMMIPATLKAAGHQVRFAPTSLNRLSNIIQEFSPQVIGFPVSTPYLTFTKYLNTNLKSRFSFVSVFGGKHPTLIPEIIDQGPDVDVVAMGEADLSFPELMTRMETGDDYHLTKGFWIRRDGIIYKNERADLVEDLDSLPFMDRDEIFKLVNYQDYPVKGFVSGRCCPYNCSYCFNKRFREIYGSKNSIVRQRSVENLILEMEQVRSKYGMGMSFFIDDVFSADKKWLYEFCDVHTERIGLPFAIGHRLDFLDGDLIEALAKTGCNTILTGIEAGNTTIRYELLNRRMTDELILERTKQLRDAGIKIVILNILGLPTTVLDDDLATYDLNRKCKVDYGHSSIFQPYPGTELTDLAVRKGIFKGASEDLKPKDYLQGRSRLNIPERKARERLNRLFSTALVLDLKPQTVKWLVKLPLGSIYNIVRIVIKGMTARKQLFPVKIPLSKKIHMAIRMFKSHI